MLSSWIEPAAGTFRHRLFGSRIYDLSLQGSAALDVRPLPVTFPGDREQGAAFAVGEIASIFEALEQQQATRGVHCFDWLPTLAASGLGTAPGLARGLTEAWIRNFGSWTAEAWRSDVLAERVTNWLLYYGFLMTGETGTFSPLCHRALSRQVTHLRRALWLGARPSDGLAVAKGLIHAGTGIDGYSDTLRQDLMVLDRSIGSEILADGCHLSRNPSQQLSALAALLQVRTVLIDRHIPPPDPLNNAIDRMVPMLRAFRHGDGRLAVFNGSNENDREPIDRVIERSGVRGRAVVNARYGGFQRLKCKNTLVIVDTGPTNLDPQPDGGHASALAFEMSVGKNRVVVNCGQTTGSGALREMLRGTAAHSIVTIGDRNSCELVPGGGYGERQSYSTDSVRREIDGNVLVELEHDGYRQSFGVSHRRSLYLSADGNDLRGEDIIRGERASEASIRFHLHPSVKVSLVGGGESVLLRFGRSQGWRFRAAPGTIALEESLYFGEGERRKSNQIVVSNDRPESDRPIKWRISRESSPSA